MAGAGGGGDDREPGNEGHEQEKEEEEEIEERKEEVAEMQPPDGMDPVFAALLEACRQVGYDSTHDKRKELVSILECVQLGDAFPPDILDRVMETTQQGEKEVLKVLKPQILRVLDAMRNAVLHEERRLEELRRLEEEARLAEDKAEKERILAEIKEKTDKQERVQAQLRSIGRCPYTFTWHPDGSGGWQCSAPGCRMSAEEAGVSSY